MLDSSYTHFIQVAVPRPVKGLFSYALTEEQSRAVGVGGWAVVSFGRSKMHAFVVEAPQTLNALPASIDRSKLKPVMEIGCGDEVIPPDVMRLCQWAADYYHSPVGEVFHCAVPAASLGLKNKKRAAREMDLKSETSVFEKHALTEAQLSVVQTLDELRIKPGVSSRAALLKGVTGSGKTEVYLEIARRVLAQGKSVLILVPEIALTPQLHARFEQNLGVYVGLWHSAMADGQRRDLGHALRARQIRAVVGARSAVFCPLHDVGLIVVDEEHDASYKQEDRVRYHARDLAVVRAKFNDALVVLGSATPGLETLERVREGKYILTELRERVQKGGLPQIELVNLAEEPRVEGVQALFAETTIKALKETIEAGQQAMIFLNRRGFAAFLLCEECGEVTGCPNCSISLTVHMKQRALRCHVCGHQEAIAVHCQKCQGTQLKPMGAGTESIETELPSLLPGVRVLRLDRDQVTSATRLEQVLNSFRAREADVLLGTQMLVKGHDFPDVTLVVVVLADSLFRWPEFRSTERAYQILTQVAGRAGRRDQPGRVLIQTFQPDHPVLQAVTGVVSEEQWLAEERALREPLLYPPFGRLARLRLESRDSEEARKVATEIARVLEAQGKVEVLGPSEAFLEKAKGIYRWDITLRSKDLRALHSAILGAEKWACEREVALHIDVDPQGV